MSDPTPENIAQLVHQALAARVSVLLGQSSFTDLLATQDRVCLPLVRLAVAAQPGAEGQEMLAHALLQALELDPEYYDGSDLDFLATEGLSSAGMVLAEAVRGHESDSRTRWLKAVVPTLDHVAAFVLSVFDGAWARSKERLTLSEWMRRQAA